MKTKKQLTWISLMLILAFLLGACQPRQSSTPKVEAGSTFFTGWNVYSEDSQVQEIVNGNHAKDMTDLLAEWQRAAQSRQLSMDIGCCDGRYNRSNATGAQDVANGNLQIGDVDYIETGTLAASVVDQPWAQNYIHYYQIRGQIKGIDVVTHTMLPDCKGCGAQGVKADLDAFSQTMNTLDSKGLGLTGRFVQKDVYSADPATQAILNGEKAFRMSGSEMEVTAWVFDHLKQEYIPVAQWMPGVGLVATAVPMSEIHPYTKWNGVGIDPSFLSERAKALLADNKVNSPLAAQQAKDLKFDTHQSFDAVVFNDTGKPSGLLMGRDAFGPDKVFNASVMAAPDAPMAEFQQALEAAFAAGEYGIAHSTDATEVFGFFSSRERAEYFLERLKQSQVIKGYLADVTKQEATVFVVDKNGLITDTLLLKPAFTAVTEIATTLRGWSILGYKDGWYRIKGSYSSPREKIVEFKPVGSGYTWRELLPEGLTAEEYLLGSQTQARALKLDPGKYSITKEGNRVVFNANEDLGETLPSVMARDGWGNVSNYLNKAEDLALALYNSSEHIAFIDDVSLFNVNVLPSGDVAFVDWEYAVHGKDALVAFPTADEYIFEFRRMMIRSYYARRNITQRVNPQMWASMPEEIVWNRMLVDEIRGVMSGDMLKFEKAVAELKSTSPETVAAARNTLRSMGVIEVDGQWVIMGANNVAYASGPIRFSSLATTYPDGAHAFVGWQTENLGVIGVERAENVSGGLFGWRLYAPKLSFAGKTVMGVPVTELLAEGLNDALIAVSVTVVANDIKDVATQTQFMAVGPNTMQVPMDPPISANYQIFTKPSKWPYVSTQWSIPLVNLQSGCNMTGFPNGCGAYLPVDQESPIVILGSLAGTTLPEQGAVSVGLDGQSVLTTWSYTLNADGTFSVWHDDQWLQSGTSIDYFETKLNEWGIWTIPYHAELQTATCAGLCITQSHGGEELLFTQGSQPVQMDLCPQGAGIDPCYWRP